MTKELAKNFEAQAVEDGIYQKWEESGFFNPDNLKLPVEAPNYTIVLPPPNITDKLHIGHAAMLSISDLFIRYKRLQGFRTLWLPGTDHAAIATQTVVEKKVLKEEGKTRHALGREEFLKRVWAFVNTTQATILNQTKKMGSSLDWSRLAFTLDEPRKKAVEEMFIQMYNDGLIYRGERVINWCPRCQSTLADDEVEHEEQQAKLYTFKYSADFPITISTTRPETKLGDTAVAVNQKDERYKQYIGQEFSVDFCGQTLKLKIIADRNVEMEFGTGALGVTPAHSFVDAQMALANNLPTIKVIDENAKIHDGFGVFSGLTVLEAREAIVAELEKRGLLISTEDMQNNLSVCYRCGTAIEPLPSKQWFVAVDKPLARLNNKSLKEIALTASQAKQIEFIPARFSKKYENWMENLKDWCISRQIWFGHEIPVYYKGEEIFVGKEKPDGDDWVKDTDTLDTWFSSGMWTFSTLGWPEQTADLKKYQPTQMMETGYELITLWISRMIMMSYYATGNIPFEKVYLHGMVLDKNGKKMSKSKGNGVDPLDMIKLYGTDATRLSLLIGTTPGNDTRFSEEKVEVAKNFVNKLWNIAKFTLTQIGEAGEIDKANLVLPDAWILSRLEKTKAEVTKLLETYEFSAAGDVLKDFTINDVADWYLESAKFKKSASTPAVLKKILRELLIMWHPFMPFVTETIWPEINETELLLVAKWPEDNNEFINEEVEASFEKIKEVVVAIRNLRAENKVEPARKLPVVIVASDQALFAENSELITSLRTGVAVLTFAESAPAEAVFAKTSSADIYLLEAVDKELESKRLAKELAEAEALVARLTGQLANEEFVNNAPKALVEKEQARLAEAKEKIEKIKSQIK